MSSSVRGIEGEREGNLAPPTSIQFDVTLKNSPEASLAYSNVQYSRVTWASDADMGICTMAIGS